LATIDDDLDLDLIRGRGRSSYFVVADAVAVVSWW
jgi:hypothetical protein